MTPDEVQRLPHGLYRVFWKTDPANPSFAAVGSNPFGNRWLAPCDSISFSAFTGSQAWPSVDRVQLITPCDSVRECSDRQSLVKLGKDKLDIKQPLPDDILAIVRDLFLTGQDIDAIGVLANQLGMTQVKVPGVALVAAARSLINKAVLDEPSALQVFVIPADALDDLREAYEDVIEEALDVATTPRGERYVVRAGSRVQIRRTLGAVQQDFVAIVDEVSRSGSSLVVSPESPQPDFGGPLQRMSLEDVYAIAGVASPNSWMIVAGRARVEPRRGPLMRALAQAQGPTDFEVTDNPPYATAPKCALIEGCRYPRGHLEQCDAGDPRQRYG